MPWVNGKYVLPEDRWEKLRGTTPPVAPPAPPAGTPSSVTDILDRANQPSPWNLAAKLQAALSSRMSQPVTTSPAGERLQQYTIPNDISPMPSATMPLGMSAPVAKPVAPLTPKVASPVTIPSPTQSMLNAAAYAPTNEQGSGLTADEFAKAFPQKSYDPVYTAPGLPLAAYLQRQAAEQGTKAPPMSAAAKIATSLAAGAGDVTSTVGGAARWLGAEDKGKKIAEAGKATGARYTLPSEEFTWKRLLDPDFYLTNVARSIPFSVSLIPAAIVGSYAAGAAGAVLGLGAFGKAVIGAVGAGSINRALESALEAGGTYNEALERGMTKEQADQAAQQVFKDNLKLVGLDIGEFATSFVPLGSVAGKVGATALGRAAIGAGRILATGAQEALEEGAQEFAQAKALGDAQGKGLGGFMEFAKTPQAQEAMSIGAIHGGGLGTIGSAYNTVQEIKARVFDGMPPTAQESANKTVQQLVSQGIDETAAKEAVLNMYASTKEGETLVDRITKEVAAEFAAAEQREGQSPPTAPAATVPPIAPQTAPQTAPQAPVAAATPVAEPMPSSTTTEVTQTGPVKGPVSAQAQTPAAPTAFSPGQIITTKPNDPTRLEVVSLEGDSVTLRHVVNDKGEPVDGKPYTIKQDVLKRIATKVEGAATEPVRAPAPKAEVAPAVTEPVAPVAEAAQQEPWQMTWSQHRGQNRAQIRANLQSLISRLHSEIANRDSYAVERTDGTKFISTDAERELGRKAEALADYEKRLERFDQWFDDAQGYDGGPAQREHKSAVQQALAEGKPVPAEVLADYPDLKPTTPQVAPAAPTKGASVAASAPETVRLQDRLAKLQARLERTLAAIPESEPISGSGVQAARQRRSRMEGSIDAGKKIAELQAEIKRIESQIASAEKAPARERASSAVDDMVRQLKPGDKVNSSDFGEVEIVRLNPQSVTVKTTSGYTERLPYNRVAPLSESQTPPPTKPPTTAVAAAEGEPEGGKAIASAAVPEGYILQERLGRTSLRMKQAEELAEILRADGRDVVVVPDSVNKRLAQVYADPGTYTPPRSTEVEFTQPYTERESGKEQLEARLNEDYLVIAKQKGSDTWDVTRRTLAKEDGAVTENLETVASGQTLAEAKKLAERTLLGAAASLSATDTRLAEAAKARTPTQRAAAERLSETDARLAEEVNKRIGDVVPPIGGSIRVDTRFDFDDTTPPPESGGQDTGGGKFTFDDPEVERIHQEAHGVKAESALDKARAAVDEIYRRATREFEHLPRTPEFQKLRFALNLLGKQRGIQGGKTVESLRGMLIEMEKNPEAYNLFERKVLLDDLAEEATQGHTLPNGWTSEGAHRNLARIEREMERHPAVRKALDERKKLWDSLKADYIEAQEAIGFKVADRFSRENYFRHQVLDHAQQRAVTGTGNRVRTPTGRGFLKQREGRDYLMNTNYLEAEYEVMAQMRYDTEVANVIKLVADTYDISAKLKEKAKQLSDQRGEKVDWRDLLPEGYSLWQPREGNLFFMANTISERLAMQIAEGTLDAAGLTAEQIKSTLAMGGKRTELVVKTEIADTLDNMGKAAMGPSSRLVRTMVGGWKEWQLISPTRALKYNFRNLTGDAEAVFLGNPAAFKKAPRAVAELYAYMYGKKTPTGRLAEFVEMGGMESTLQVAELKDINELKVFADMLERKEGNILKRGLDRYWRGARLATDFRESILRYAAYLDFMEQLEANNGRPTSWGASDPDMVMALETNQQKAFLLSNQLLGAYDEVSVMTQGLRRGLMPFFSWQEVNAKRYVQMMKNVNLDAKATTALGKKVTIGMKRAPFLVFKAGAFIAKAGAMWAMLQAYNNTVWPEEEKDLRAEIRRTPHIILGRDPDGKVKYFSRLGMLEDFLEWFTDDASRRAVADWLNGRVSAYDAARSLVKGLPAGVANKLIQSMGPVKTLVEAGVGKSYYPDISRPSTIRDKGQFLARSVGLGDLYNSIAGLPQRSWKDVLEGMAYYKDDPGESAYWDIRDMVREFQEKIGKLAYSGGSFSPRSNALYNLRLSLRYGDKTAALKYANEYYAQGGTDAGLLTSLNNMDPLHSLNADEQAAFIMWYGNRVGKEDAKQRLSQAYTFFTDVITGKKLDSDKDKPAKK